MMMQKKCLQGSKFKNLKTLSCKYWHKILNFWALEFPVKMKVQSSLNLEHKQVVQAQCQNRVEHHQKALLLAHHPAVHVIGADDGEAQGLIGRHGGGGDALGQLLLDLLDRTVTLSQELHQQHGATPQRHQALKEGLLHLYVHSLREHGCTLSVQEVSQALALDIELNAQGIAVWLDRPAKNS